MGFLGKTRLAGNEAVKLALFSSFDLNSNLVLSAFSLALGAGRPGDEVALTSDRGSLQTRNTMIHCIDSKHQASGRKENWTGAMCTKILYTTHPQEKRFPFQWMGIEHDYKCIITPTDQLNAMW